MAPCSWNMLPWWYVCILTIKWCVRMNDSRICKSRYTSVWLTLSYVEIRFWNCSQLITDLIFTKCMLLFFFARLRVRVHGPEQSASEETVLKALWVGIIRGALLRNELRHLSHSLWNPVFLNEINQSWSSAPFVWMWKIENSAVKWETVSKIP